MNNVGQLTFYPIIILVIIVDQLFFSYITFVMNEGQLTFLSTNNSCDKCRSTYLFVQLLIL